MVTLALFSMMGMMGLAVDLGWSYFSQKQAQAAADSAALAAAQEAVTRLGVSSDVSGFNCGSTGVGANKVECTEAAGIVDVRILRLFGRHKQQSEQRLPLCKAKRFSIRRCGFQADCQHAIGRRYRCQCSSGRQADFVLGEGADDSDRSSIVLIHSRTPERDGGRERDRSHRRLDHAGIVLRHGPSGRLPDRPRRWQLWPGRNHRPRQRRRQRRFASNAVPPSPKSDLCAPAGIILASSCNSKQAESV